MKFIQANIYGFGKWVDETITFPDTKPICFYGENESGKTTIQQFVLYVLFGLPPRKLARYKPLNSNKIGGMLIVEDENIGQYSIERIEQDVICYDAAGELQSEAWLEHCLQGINREVFTSIYAFSAVDLTAIQTMKRTDLSDVLFSVGLTGSTDIYEAEKQLAKRTDDLFKPQGRIPQMNKQLNETATIHQELMDIQQKEAQYEQKQSLLKQLQEEKAIQDEREATLQATSLKEEKIQTLLPQLHEYEQYKHDLQQYPKQIPFPENGVERLEQVKETMLPLKSELQGLKNRMEHAQNEKTENERNLYRETLIEEAKAVVQQKASYQYLLEQQKNKQAQIERVERELANEIGSIQMTVDEIDDLTLPFHLEKHWTTLARNQEALLQVDEKQTTTYETLQEQETRLLHEKEQLKERQIQEVEIQQLHHQLSEASPNSSSTSENRAWKPWQDSRMRTAKNILISSAVIAIITIIIALFMENAILLAIPFILLTGGVVQFFNVKRTIDYFKGDMDNPTNESHYTYEDLQQLLQEQYELQREIAVIDKQLGQIKLERTHWQKEQTEFLKKENTWIQQVEQEKATYPFLHATDLPYWTDLLVIIRKVQQLLSEKSDVITELNDINEQLEKMALQQANISKQLYQGNSVLTFEQLEEIVQKQQAKQHVIGQLDEQIDDYEKTVEQMQQEISVYEVTLAELFAIANVDHEEAYLQVAKHKQMREQIQSSMESTKAQLSMMFSETETEQLLQEIRSEQDVAIQIANLQQSLTETKQKQESLNEQIAKLQLEIEQLELSNDHSTAIYQYQMEVDTLQQQAESWAILKVAQTALAQAKLNYQANHLEAVLQHTSSFFQTLTTGRYRNVFAPMENESFEVEGNDYIRYTIDKLSQGTVDQLYISLRLAISVVMSERYKMPLMMDDAFVHFDEARMNNMLAIVKQLAEKQQVIIFTCNRLLANQLQSTHLNK